MSANPNAPYLYLDQQRLMSNQLTLPLVTQPRRNSRFFWCCTGRDSVLQTDVYHLGSCLTIGSCSQIYSITAPAQNLIVKVIPLQRCLLHSARGTWDEVQMEQASQHVQGPVVSGQFNREARTTVKMSEAGIAPYVLAHGIAQVQYDGDAEPCYAGCIVMQRIQYTTTEYLTLLRQHGSSGRSFPPDELWERWTRMFVAQMKSAWSEGIVHRHLDTDNIMVNVDRDTLEVEQLYLIDFDLLETPVESFTSELYRWADRQPMIECDVVEPSVK